MSAYLVSNKTLFTIAKAMQNYDCNCDGYKVKPVISGIEETQLYYNAKKLFDRNVKSLCYRYSSDKKEDYEHFFKYEEPSEDLTDVIGCIMCYQYQASEEPNYMHKDEFIKLNCLKNRILEDIAGDEMPWGLD